MRLDKYNERIIFTTFDYNPGLTHTIMVSISMTNGAIFEPIERLVTMKDEYRAISSFKNENEIYIETGLNTFRYSNGVFQKLYKTIYAFDEQGDDSKSYFAMIAGPYPGIYNYQTNVKLYNYNQNEQMYGIRQIRVFDSNLYIRIGDIIYQCSTSTVNGGNIESQPKFYEIPKSEKIFDENNKSGIYALYEFDITTSHFYYSSSNPPGLFQVPIINGVLMMNEKVSILNFTPISFHYHKGYIYYAYYNGSYGASIFKTLSIKGSPALMLYTSYGNYFTTNKGNCVSNLPKVRK